VSKPIKAARAIVRGNATLLGKVGARVYPAGGVPPNAVRPYIRTSLQDIEKDEDLDGNVDGRLATVGLLLVGDTSAQVAELVAVLESGGADEKGQLDGLSGTFGGVAVRETQISDGSVSDVSEEPVEVDDGDGYVAQASLEILYD
jgi:hypothetical protein